MSLLDDFIGQLRVVQSELEKTGSVSDEAKAKLSELLVLANEVMQTNPELVSSTTAEQAQELLAPSQTGNALGITNPELWTKISNTLQEILAINKRQVELSTVAKTTQAPKSDVEAAKEIIAPTKEATQTQKVVEAVKSVPITSTIGESSTVSKTLKVDTIVANVIKAATPGLDTYLANNPTKSVASMVGVLETVAKQPSHSFSTVVSGEGPSESDIQKWRAYQEVAKQMNLELGDYKYSPATSRMSGYLVPSTASTETQSIQVEKKLAVAEEKAVVATEEKTQVTQELSRAEKRKVDALAREVELSNSLEDAIKNQQGTLLQATRGTEPTKKEINQWQSNQKLAGKLGYTLSDYTVDPNAPGWMSGTVQRKAEATQPSIPEPVITKQVEQQKANTEQETKSISATQELATAKIELAQTLQTENKIEQEKLVTAPQVATETTPSAVQPIDTTQLQDQTKVIIEAGAKLANAEVELAQTFETENKVVQEQIATEKRVAESTQLGTQKPTTLPSGEPIILGRTTGNIEIPPLPEVPPPPAVAPFTPPPLPPVPAFTPPPIDLDVLSEDIRTKAKSLFSGFFDEGLSANAALERLKEQGLGYRRETFLEDYQRLRPPEITPYTPPPTPQIASFTPPIYNVPTFEVPPYVPPKPSTFIPPPQGYEKPTVYGPAYTPTAGPKPFDDRSVTPAPYLPKQLPQVAPQPLLSASQLFQQTFPLATPRLPAVTESTRLEEQNKVASEAARRLAEADTKLATTTEQLVQDRTKQSQAVQEEAVTERKVTETVSLTTPTDTTVETVIPLIEAEKKLTATEEKLNQDLTKRDQVVQQQISVEQKAVEIPPTPETGGGGGAKPPRVPPVNVSSAEPPSGGPPQGPPIRPSIPETPPFGPQYGKKWEASVKMDEKQVNADFIKLRTYLSLRLDDVTKADAIIADIRREINEIIARGEGSVRVYGASLAGEPKTLAGGEVAYTPKYKLAISEPGSPDLDFTESSKSRYLTDQGVVPELPKAPEYSLKQKIGFATGEIAGFDEATTKLEQNITKQNEMYANNGAQIQKVTSDVRMLADGTVEVNTAFNDGFTTLGKTTEYLQKTANGYEVLTKAEYDAAKGAQLTNEQIQRLAQTNPEVFTKAGKYGFKPESLQTAKTEASTGATRYQFSQTDDQGVIRQLSMTTDRFGGVMVDTSRKFRGFIDTIRRDMVSFAEWGISAAVVYGSFQKLNEIVQIAIKNQSALADVIIALGTAQKSTNDIFAEAAKVAQATGESIDGVLESYTLAYRATGTISDQNLRFAATNKILTDSLILSKLSGMDHAASLDALAGALRQLPMETKITTASVDEVAASFDKGINLIDQWVLVTRNANVDMETLATSFSITAESAVNAGMSIEQLNAVVAVLSSKIGMLGPKETGNAVRALVGGLYQQGAADELAKFGIAVTDTEGRTRSFLDVMNQIYLMNKEGLISEDQLNKIGYVLGGGVRRGQQYVATLKDIGEVNRLVSLQADADGTAQAALAIKMNLVETSVTQLGNAFQILAQSIGSESGVLTLMKDLLDISTALVTMFSKVTGVIGASGVAIAGLAAGMAIFGGKGLTATGRRQSYLDIFGNSGANIGGAFGGGLGATSSRTTIFSGGALGTTLSANSYGVETGSNIGRAIGEKFGSMLPGIIGVGLSSALNYQQGNFEQAGGNIVGGILGGLVTGFSPVGMIIGSMIAESFVNYFKEKPIPIQEMFPDRYREQGKGTTTAPELPKTQEELRAEYQKIVMEEYAKAQGVGSSEKSGGMAANFSQWLINMGKGLVSSVGITAPPTPENSFQFALQYPGVATNPRVLAAGQALEKFVPPAGGVLPTTPSIIAQNEVQTAFGDTMTEYANDIAKKLLDQLISGKISAKAYTEGTGLISALPSRVSGTYTAVGEEFDKSLSTITGKEATIKALMDILTNSPKEATDSLNILVNEINDFNDKVALSKDGMILWKNAAGLMERTPIATILPAIKKDLIDAHALTLQLYNDFQKSITALPTIVDMSTITKEQYKQYIEPETIAAQKKTVMETVPGITTEEKYQEWKQIQLPDTFYIQLKDGLIKIGPAMFSQEFLNKGLDWAKEAGKIISENISISAYDETQSENFRAAYQAYPEFKKTMENAGYTAKEEEQIVVMSDGSINKFKVDTKLMQILLQQISDNTAKTVDGIYNLPSGGTFYVPSTAFLGGAGGGGGGTATDFVNKLHMGEGFEDTTTIPPATPYENMPESVQTTYREATTPTGTEYPPTGGLLDWYYKMHPELGTEPNFSGSISGVDPSKFYSDFLNSITPTTPTAPGGGGSLPQKMLDLYPYMGIGAGAGVGASSLGGLDINALKNIFTTAFSTIKSKVDFKLNMSSTTTLVVDGRQMANVVKKYLYDDLLSNDTTLSTSI